MNFKIGDVVRFLNDVGGGKITKIIDKETVLVLNEDGFDMPVLMKELLKIEEEQDFFQSTRKKVEVVEKQVEKKEVKAESFDNEEEDTYVKETDEINIYLALVPKDMEKKGDCDLDMYLINDSNYKFLYNIQKVNEKLVESKPGKLTANTKEFIETVKRENILSLEHLNFQIIFYKNVYHEIKKPLDKQIKMNITKLFRDTTFCENDFFDENAYIHTIFEENVIDESVSQMKLDELKKVIEQKENINQKINTPKQFQKNIKDMQIEVDLHIHELVDDHKGLSPTDIIEIQMKTFTDEIESAIKNPKISKVVFIHGIGNGTLKTEIRRELERKYKKFKFQDASFKEYGYGATLVHVK